MATAKELRMWFCPEHMNQGQCPKCQAAMHWNLLRRYCHCGVPAVGYRIQSHDADVEFFCDDHFVVCADA